MKNHTVSTGTAIQQFLETDNPFDIEIGGCQIWGQADSITEFVTGLELENEWMPYGYVLRVVFRPTDSKNFTAHLFRIGQKFLTR